MESVSHCFTIRHGPRSAAITGHQAGPVQAALQPDPWPKAGPSSRNRRAVSATVSTS